MRSLQYQNNPSHAAARPRTQLPRKREHTSRRAQQRCERVLQDEWSAQDKKIRSFKSLEIVFQQQNSSFLLLLSILNNAFRQKYFSTKASSLKFWHLGSKTYKEIVYIIELNLVTDERARRYRISSLKIHWITTIVNNWLQSLTSVYWLKIYANCFSFNCIPTNKKLSLKHDNAKSPNHFKPVQNRCVSRYKNSHAEKAKINKLTQISKSGNYKFDFWASFFNGALGS